MSAEITDRVVWIPDITYRVVWIPDSTDRVVWIPDSTDRVVWIPDSTDRVVWIPDITDRVVWITAGSYQEQENCSIVLNSGHTGKVHSKIKIKSTWCFSRPMKL